MSAPAGPVRYGGWAKDRQGWFLGLGGGGLVTILIGGLPLLLAAGAHRWLLALAWIPVWATLIVLVAVPVKGRSALRWAIDSVYRGAGVAMHWTDWQSKAAAGTVEDFDEADLPGVLSGIRTHDGPPHGPTLSRPAIIADNKEHTWAVVARITHPGIGLAETPARTRMGNGLAELLEGTASAELVSVLAVQVRTVPDDGAERAAWQQANLRRDAPPLCLQVNAELGAVMTQTGVRHEAFVTVVVPEARIAKQAKEAGGGIDGRARVLYGVMGGIEAGLLGPVGATSVTWLDSPALAAAIRTGFAPGDRAALTAAELAALDDPRVAAMLPMAAAGPTSTAEPGPPQLRPRRLAVGDLHDPAAGQGRDHGRAGPGVHPDHGRGTAQRHRVLRTDRPPPGRPASRQGGDVRRDRRGGPAPARLQGTRRAPPRRGPGGRPRHPPRRRQRAAAGGYRRVGDRAGQLVDQRLRPAAGIQHHRQRLQTAAPGPRPGLRVRRRLHPVGDRAAQTPRGEMMPDTSKLPTRREARAYARTRTGRSFSRSGTGRGVAQLVADFGHHLPPLTAPPPAVKDSDPFTVMVGRHGRSGRAAGWCPVPAPLAVYRMTSEQVGGIWPLIAGDGLPSTGALMGIDWLSGGAFHADPIGWTVQGIAGVTNPNMMFFGAPGRGKSGTVKMFCLRMMAYAYRTLILGDVKDEYEALCRALGVEPHAVGHGLFARINPLDFGPLGSDWGNLPRTEALRRAAITFSRWLVLIGGLVGSQGVPFTASDKKAVRYVIRDLTGYTDGATRLTEITIPQVWHGLDQPSDELVAPAATPTANSSSTAPGRSATRSARWSTGTWPGCSTRPPPSPSTGAPRSSPCRCPGSTHSATKRSGSR